MSPRGSPKEARSAAKTSERQPEAVAGTCRARSFARHDSMSMANAAVTRSNEVKTSQGQAVYRYQPRHFCMQQQAETNLLVSCT